MARVKAKPAAKEPAKKKRPRINRLPPATDYYSVSEIAKKRGVANTTVIAWMKSGELRYELNSCSPSSQKPRYVATRADYEEFCAKRAGRVAPVRPRSRSTNKDEQTAAVEFFKAAKRKAKQ